ncbi:MULTISPECIES: holin [unclassified Listeria]|uniref:holin n=1 Tax=unclassified Listeria TaxID=2642072 RepID=UPI000B5967BB|nr:MULTISPECIES: holin [unclassified Listeria]
MNFGEELLAYMTFLTISTTAIVQVVKSTNKIPRHYLPLVSLMIGITVGGLATLIPGAGSISVMLWSGGLAGLGGTGLFEQFTKRDGNLKGDDSK